MSEGSGGYHDRQHQAEPGWKKALRRVTLVAAGLAAIGGGVKVVDQIQRPPVESFDSVRDRMSFIDTGEYVIVIHLEGGEDLLFRRDPNLSNNPATDNTFSASDIAEINGKKWDGVSPISIKNSPVHFQGDRYTGQGANPIFMFELGVRSMLGEIIPTVGYIDHGKAHGRVIQLRKGEIAKVGTDNDGKLIGVLGSGENIPNSEIGITQVLGTSTTTVVGNPKK